MDCEAFDVVTFGNHLFIGLCFCILIQNAAFPRLNIFNFFLNLQMRVTSSFMASGGVLLYMQWVTETPVLAGSGQVVSLNAVDKICGKNCSESSLPTARYKDTKKLFYVDNTRCVVYFTCVLMFAYCDLIAKGLLSGVFCFPKKKRGIEQIIPLATSIMLPGDNENVRRPAIVQLMIKKLQYLQLNIMIFMAIEFFYFCVALFGLLVNPVRFILSENLAVRSNGSEWTVVCGRQVTSQDVYALARCQSISNNGRIKSYCIVPNNSSLFHLETVTWFFFLLLSVSCAVSFLCRMYSICKLGLLRATDKNLVRFLKQNLDYRRHKATIDLFDVELEEMARKTTKEKRSGCSMTEEKEKPLLNFDFKPDEGEGKMIKERRCECCLMEGKAKAPPLTKDLEQGVAENNGDAVIVQMDVAIAKPD